MPTVLNFKDLLDLPDWRPTAVAPNASAAGISICSDMRGSEDRIPAVFQLVSNAIFNKYSPKNDGWTALTTPTLAGTFGAGAGSVVAPARGPRGVLAAGSTSTTLVVPTASFPGTLGPNTLANRGDGRGYLIRVIGNATGASAGKTEERLIIGNTLPSGGNTTVRLASALSFTPATSDNFEVLSGRVYLLGAGAAAAGQFKAYDIASNAYSGNLSITNLPATINTDCSFVVMDELYVPNTSAPGEGFLLGTGAGGIAGRALTATASGATSLTGQAASGDAAVLVNEYRNFQIRIVQDTTTPAATGQRRKITSHTAGASPVYTVPAWTTTPSATAQYVIEFSNEILLWSSASANTHTYAQDAIAGGQAADSWSTATYAVRPAVMAAGCSSFLSCESPLDADKNARFSFLFSFRGGAVSTLDLFDIAGAATGSWTGAIPYGGSGPTFTTGTCCANDPFSDYAYINQSGTQNFYRFDSKNRVLEPWAFLRFAQGAAVVGGKMAALGYVDGNTKVALVFTLRNTAVEMFQSFAQR